MLRWCSDYVIRNQRRLIAGVEASFKQAPLRMALIGVVYIMLGQYVPLWVTLVSALLCYADDLALFVIRRRLKQRPALTDLMALAVFNAVGAVALAWFIGYALLYASAPMGEIAALVVLAAILIELSSPKARSHPFALVTFLPFWAAMFGVTMAEVFRLETSTLELVTGVLALVVAGGYALHVFVENLDRIRDLERESERAALTNAQRTRFLATVSHEIRTPLHAVYGTSQLLNTTRDPAEVQRLSQILMAAAQDLKIIVDDVIDFERAEAGRTSLHLSPQDACALVERVGALFRANVQAKGLTLVTRWPKDMEGRGVLLDPVRVGQVLSNLVSHAIACTDTGQISLLMEADPSGKILRFIVRDSGRGIAADDQARLFEPYEALGAAPGLTHSGAGLGLAISKLLAQRMGGGLSMQDAPGGGSDFTLTLPLVEEPLPAQSPAVPAEPQLQMARSGAATPPAPAAKRPAGPADGGKVLTGTRILVVDDVAINREVLRVMLERHGAEVMEAGNGREALEKIDKDPPDVMLLDNAMPVMSGSEALAKLRADPGPKAKLPVIGISAGTIREECDAFIALGLDGFLSKPVSIPDLLSAITSTHGRASPASAAPRRSAR